MAGYAPATLYRPNGVQMMIDKYDLEGKKFGKLTVLHLDKVVNHSRYWLCQCECGNVKSIRAGHLLQGKIKGCGCLRYHDKNEYRIVGDVAYVTMTGSDKSIMICDASDWEKLKDHVWNCACSGYATTCNRGSSLKYKEFHRNVIECKDGLFVDHINRNRLDNRRCNLRLVTPFQNSLNRNVSKNSESGYLGVRKRENGKYQARITLDGKTYSLGSFDTIEEAIDARKIGEEKMFLPRFDNKEV